MTDIIPSFKTFSVALFITHNIILITTISTASTIVPEMLFFHVNVTLSCSQVYQDAQDL